MRFSLSQVKRIVVNRGRTLNKKLFVISGCSGVGKGTVLKEFMARNSDDFYAFCFLHYKKTSCWVKLMGLITFFLTHEEFEKAVQEDKFLEHAQFAGNFTELRKVY